MAFSDDAQSAETYGCIKDECKRLGFNASRVDENVGSGPIILEIREGILRAEFIIADLTLERPNVYYELGYAHGTNNGPLDIFLIARAGTNLHFDLSHLRVMFYESPEELRHLLQTKFAGMIQRRREQRRAQAQTQTPSTSEAENYSEGVPPEDANIYNTSAPDHQYPESPS